jgi:hypoxanthine phosphoribosyltransferase
MNKVYYTQDNVNRWVHHMIRSMNSEAWRPDYIVGLTRGGLVPAVMLSQYLNIPMHTLNVSLRDSDFGPESNLWMAEDAFGHDDSPDAVAKSNPDLRKKILIVDDINDSGATLNWIKQDWLSGCFPNDEGWNDIWNNNVRVAVLIQNEASEFKNIDYVGKIINKMEKDEWCVFPWENWWE